MDGEIRHILEDATLAPSGENCQPWHFYVSGSTIEVHVVPEQDRSLYSWGDRASYVAVGAAIENIVISASGQAYRAEVALFPNSNPVHVATITLHKDSAVAVSPWSAVIAARATNRKPFQKESLSEEALQKLRMAGQEGFLFTNIPASIQTLGNIGAVNESVMLSNKELHQFFFEHVNWTTEEDRRKTVGFFIDTLELPPPARFGFKVLRSWNRAQVLNALGFYKMVGAQNGFIYGKAGAMGLYSCAEDSPRAAVEAGRAIERMWLEATRLGLSLQPLTGVLYFMLRLRAGDTRSFSSEQISLIRRSYAGIEEIFNVQGRTLYFMCRIGRSEPPSARSSRFPLSKVITETSHP